MKRSDPSPELFSYAVHFRPKPDQFHVRLVEQLHGELVWIVPVEDHSADSRVDDHLGAVMARLAGDVERGPAQRYAMKGALDDGVLLRVQRADAVSVHNLAADLRTVRQPVRRPVVP